LKIKTRLAKAGGDPDPTTGALVPPIHASSTYERDPDGGYSRGYVYARWANPTRTRLEETLADLEGGYGAAVFPAGMAAVDGILRTLEPGDHVILPGDVYHATRQLLREILSTMGVEYSEAEYSNPESISAASRPDTRLILIETPSNPLCKITDIRAASDLAREAGIETVVDNTWATPLLQRPLELGADYVVHSLTKYLSGHSDVLAGAVVSRAASPRFERLRHIQRVAGSVASPFDCWLTLRGIRSLGARMKLHCSNARALADYLVAHPRVTRVHYPGLTSHPLHELARRQMDDFGAMMSFEIDGDERDAVDVAARVEVFTRATSLGGTESLIEHRASIESKPTSTPVTLLRLSVGLEDIDDLIEDLDRALQ
jgi:cystathionine gamma-synthase